MSAVLVQPPQKKTAEKIPAMCLVIHASDTPAEACIDGRGYSIPPNTIFKVEPIVCTDHNNNGPYEYTTPAHHVMKALLDQCWSWGLVEVPTIEKKTRYGVNYEADEEAAHAKAEEAMIAAEEKIIMLYVQEQQRRVREGVGAMPPGPRTAEVIEKRKIDLEKEYNLKPIGYGTVSRAADNAAEMEAMKRKNAELEEMLRRLTTLVEGQNGKKGKTQE